MTGGRTLRVLVIIDSLTHGGAELLLTDFVGRRARRASSRRWPIWASATGARPRSGCASRGRAGLHPIDGLAAPRLAERGCGARARGAPDIVHTHLDYADFMGGVASRSLGIPMVSTVHVMDWRAGGTRERARRPADRLRAPPARRQGRHGVGRRADRSARERGSTGRTT